MRSEDKFTVELSASDFRVAASVTTTPDLDQTDVIALAIYETLRMARPALVTCPIYVLASTVSEDIGDDAPDELAELVTKFIQAGSDLNAAFRDYYQAKRGDGT